jgi:hypothetical protein
MQEGPACQGQKKLCVGSLGSPRNPAGQARILYPRPDPYGSNWTDSDTKMDRLLEMPLLICEKKHISTNNVQRILRSQ